MNSSYLKNWFILALSFATIMLFTQCDSNNDVEPETETEDVLLVDEEGTTSFSNTAFQVVINLLPKEDLSAAEESGLIFMREEEKLAHDVYVKLYEKWGMNIFNNIAQSETTHTDAVLVLLNKYDLTDPVGTNGIGVFVNTTLQGLYDNLTVAGFENQVEALKVGAAIEEIDIRDLENELNNNVDNEDIELLYENLEKGSRNHLRAFVRNLNNRGVTYIPQYLSVEEYQEIINGDMEKGGN